MNILKIPVSMMLSGLIVSACLGSNLIVVSMISRLGLIRSTVKTVLISILSHIVIALDASLIRLELMVYTWRKKLEARFCGTNTFHAFMRNVRAINSSYPFDYNSKRD